MRSAYTIEVVDDRKQRIHKVNHGLGRDGESAKQRRLAGPLVRKASLAPGPVFACSRPLLSWFLPPRSPTSSEVVNLRTHLLIRLIDLKKECGHLVPAIHICLKSMYGVWIFE
jgi:hypothetical protein